MKTLFCGKLLKHDSHIVNIINEIFYVCGGHA